MPHPDATQVETCGRAEALLHSWAQTAAIPTPHLRVLPYVKGGAAAGPGDGTARIDIDVRLLNQPADVSDPVLAHEFGHIALGHYQRSRWRWHALPAAVGALPFPPVLTALAWRSQPSWLVSALAAASVAVIVLVTAVKLFEAAGFRARELDADSYGARVLYCPMTAQTAAWLDARIRSRVRPPAVLRHHPSWEQRLQALEATRRGHDAA